MRKQDSAKISATAHLCLILKKCTTNTYSTVYEEKSLFSFSIHYITTPINVKGGIHKSLVIPYSFIFLFTVQCTVGSVNFHKSRILQHITAVAFGIDKTILLKAFLIL